MCQRGGWRGIGIERIGPPDQPYTERPICAIEQCDECGSYRAVDIEDCELVTESDNEGW